MLWGENRGMGENKSRIRPRITSFEKNVGSFEETPFFQTGYFPSYLPTYFPTYFPLASMGSYLLCVCCLSEKKTIFGFVYGTRYTKPPQRGLALCELRGLHPLRNPPAALGSCVKNLKIEIWHSG